MIGKTLEDADGLVLNDAMPKKCPNPECGSTSICAEGVVCYSAWIETGEKGEVGYDQDEHCHPMFGLATGWTCLECDEDGKFDKVYVV